MPQLRKHIIVFEKINLDKKEWIVTKSNPKYWKNDGVRSRFEYVYAPSFPQIENAYEKAGKQVYREDGDVVIKDVVVPSEVDDVQDSNESETEEAVNDDPVTEADFEVNTPHWSELSWPKMRSIASTLTDEPIKSKEQAVEILQNAEQKGRI